MDYRNLRKVLHSRGIGMAQVSTILGVTNRTAHMKLEGDGDLYVQEAKKLHAAVPECSWEYLFATDD